MSWEKKQRFPTAAFGIWFLKSQKGEETLANMVTLFQAIFRPLVKFR